jgi:hypothetical protein
MVRGLWVGDSNSGGQAIAPLQPLPGCITQWTLTSSFYDLNDKLLNYPYGMPIFPDGMNPYEDKESRYVERALTTAEWQSILAYFITAPNQYTYAYLEIYGGAIATYPVTESAFIHRKPAFNAVLDVFWVEASGQLAAEQFLTGWVKLLEPMWNGHIYQNYPSLEAPDYAFNYWGEAQAGLYAVKVKYDPQHLFAFAQEVRPLVPPGGGPGPVIILPPALAAALAQPIDYGVVARRRAAAR